MRGEPARNVARGLYTPAPATPAPWEIPYVPQPHAESPYSKMKPAPFDPEYPELHRLGNVIMDTFPPQDWVSLAEDALKRHPVPKKIAEQFTQWIADEQRKAGGIPIDLPEADATPFARLSAESRKLLLQLLAEIQKKPPQEWLKEVRKLLEGVDLPADVETQILAYYEGLDQLWQQTWGLLHRRAPPRPATERPESMAELLVRVAHGVDKLVADGKLDELVDALRELVRRMPELLPEGARGGQFEEVARELQDLLAQFVELLALLPPDAGDVAVELLQVGLTIAGLVTGAELFDLVGGIVSARRGEWLDVFLSALALVPLVGIIAGLGKIGKRLKKLLAVVSKLRGPAREILLDFVARLGGALKEIPTNGIPAAVAGLKRFAQRVRALLDEAVAKLRKLKPGARRSGLTGAARLTADELATGRRLESKLGRRLEESSHVGAEYVDELGKTYDAIGVPNASKFWNEKRFLKSIWEHLLKSADFIVIDLTGFTPTQIEAVRKYLSTLTPEQLARIIRIGF